MNGTSVPTATDALAAFRECQCNALPYWRTRAPEVTARQTARLGGMLVWQVWCDWCQADHCHGGPGLPAHRIAPCFVPDSPYKAAGYILVAEATAVAA